jgi:hypothetical protein
MKNIYGIALNYGCQEQNTCNLNGFKEFSKQHTCLQVTF